MHCIAQAVLRGAAAIIYRGYFYRLILEARGITRPALWVPDSINGDLLDLPQPLVRDVKLIATFGTISNEKPRPQWPPYYGSELLDLLEVDERLRGMVITRGAGSMAFRQLADRRGLEQRIEWHSEQPTNTLFENLQRASFVTSYQTDDLSGWSRTTGKLPLALGAGCGLVTTRVGEASRALPKSLTFPATRHDYIKGASARVTQGWNADDARAARLSSEHYRRSRLAAELSSFLLSYC